MPAAERVERARALVPARRRRAPAAERRRRIDDETVAALRANGLFRILQPRRVGGFELDFRAQIDVAAELARGCASTAWIASVVGSHHWMLAMLPPEAQARVWDADPDSLLVTAMVTPDGKARAVAGGYELAGTWKFASGVDFADWAIVGATVAGTAPPELRVFLVPRAEFEILDSWHVAGLRATGSKDLRIARAFVPASRSAAMAELLNGAPPGRAVNPAPIYGLPVTMVTPFNMVGPAVGIARGAIETFVERMGGRLTTFGRERIGQQPTVQLRIAEAAAESDAAELVLHAACAAIARLEREPGAATDAARSRLRRDAAYAATLCRRAVERVAAMAGAHGLDDDNPLQLAQRDIQALTSHAALVWDPNAVLWGRTAFGLPSNDPRG